MFCYKCNSALSDKDYCTSCGADVAIYKKIVGLSNLYYNDGLEKARVRDLSGAIVSLKHSLKFYKNNIQARNLLGLIYFEIGETVAALGQWIISTNIQPQKNLAQGYMKTLSANQGKLDAINQTMRKYNLCLDYCRQNSYDLAIIQLKKLLSVNTHLVQGYQLLALLYIREEQYDRAYRQLQLALRIDKANTTTLHLISEITEGGGGKVSRAALKSDAGVKLIKRSEDKVEFKSGNEMIIQPTNVKEDNGIWTIVNIVVGLLIGVFATYFLIVPAKTQVVKNQYAAKEKSGYEELQEKKAQIDGLNAQIGALSGEIGAMNERLGAYEGDAGVITGLVNLIEAEKRFATGDVGGTFELLVPVNRDALPEAGKASWQGLYEACLPQILAEAENQYKSHDNCDAAMRYYDQLLAIDGSNEDAMYHYGGALAKKGAKEDAIQRYNAYLQMHPSGKYATSAAQAVAELQGQ